MPDIILANCASLSKRYTSRTMASTLARSVIENNYKVHDAFAKTNKIEATADDSSKRVFPNFLEACKHYEFPNSHRIGSVYNDTGIIRTHSNATPGKDFVLRDGHEILYRLKNDLIKEKFQLNMQSHQTVRFFRKVQHYVDVDPPTGAAGGKRKRQELKGGSKDMGEFHVRGVVNDEAFVRLVEVGYDEDATKEGEGK